MSLVRPGRQKGNLSTRVNVGKATEPCLRTCPCAFKALQPSLPMPSPYPRLLLPLEKSLPVTERMAIVCRWEPDWPRDARRPKPPPSKNQQVWGRTTRHPLSRPSRKWNRERADPAGDLGAFSTGLAAAARVVQAKGVQGSVRT